MAGYRLSRQAAADLDDIYDYTIEEHGLVSARKHLEALHACFESLAEHPMLGRRAGRVAPGMRRHECRFHVVFYVSDAPGVTIARVLHARMDVLLRFADTGDGARRT